MSKKQFKVKYNFDGSVPRCGICKHFVPQVVAGKKRAYQPPRCGLGSMHTTPVGVCDAWVDSTTGDTLYSTKEIPSYAYT